MTSGISIIIPTFNEEKQIPALCPLTEQVEEVILVDGGSSDHTVSLAKKLGLRVEKSSPGRAVQLNHGARLAKEKLLLFLHADTRLPTNFHHLINEWSTDTENPTLCGAFSLAIEGHSPLLYFISWSTNIRSRLLQLPYGDQALFIRRKDFEDMGGFPDIPVMEDFVFIRNVRKKGRIKILPECVTTSGRRWQRLGVFRTTLINQLIILGYYAGMPPEKLACFYRRKGHTSKGS